MLGVRRKLCQFSRQVHTLSRDRPSETLKMNLARLKEKKKQKDPRKNQLFVQVPESRAWLDTATMPMILTVVGTALFAKLLMMVCIIFRVCCTLLLYCLKSKMGWFYCSLDPILV